MKNEKGAVMVETTIIFPMVLMCVMAMLYLGLFMLQESAMLYQVQRVANQGSKLVASPGYEHLGIYDTKKIDFTDGDININEYYAAYRQDFATIYREIFGHPWISEGELEQFSDKIADSVLLLSAGRIFANPVKIERGFLGTKVVSEIVLEFRTPGVLRYFGFEDTISFKQAAYANSTNPADFIRNVDLITDAVFVAAEKMGIGEQVDKIVEKFNEITDFLL